jgi:hypothetical protein
LLGWLAHPQVASCVAVLQTANCGGCELCSAGWPLTRLVLRLVRQLPPLFFACQWFAVYLAACAALHAAPSLEGALPSDSWLSHPGGCGRPEDRATQGRRPWRRRFGGRGLTSLSDFWRLGGQLGGRCLLQAPTSEQPPEQGAGPGGFARPQAGLTRLQRLRLGGGRYHLGITAAAAPSHHHRQGRRRAWRGWAWGAPSVSLQRPPMRQGAFPAAVPQPVQATAEAPSKWPATQMRATPPAHRCLCCGGGHSRANKTGVLQAFGVGRGAPTPLTPQRPSMPA